MGKLTMTILVLAHCVLTASVSVADKESCGMQCKDYMQASDWCECMRNCEPESSRDCSAY